MSFILISILILIISLIPRSIRTEILLDAKQEDAWEILTNFDEYKEWNPFISFIEGKLATGNKLKVVLKQNSSSELKISPTVIEVVEGESFSWIGHLGIPYIFTGTHSFSLQYNGNKELFLIHSEKFQGILVWPLYSIISYTINSFNSMNIALKKRLSSQNKGIK